MAWFDFIFSVHHVTRVDTTSLLLLEETTLAACGIGLSLGGLTVADTAHLTGHTVFDFRSHWFTVSVQIVRRCIVVALEATL